MTDLPSSGNETVMVDSNSNVVYPSTINNMSINAPKIAGVSISGVSSSYTSSTASQNELTTTRGVVDFVNNIISKGTEELLTPLEEEIQNLKITKANNGALHFNGGGYAQCPKLLRNQPFSFAVRIKANKNDVLIKKQVNIIDMGVFYLYIHPSVQRLSVYATGTGNSLQSVTAEQNNRIFDGNWHSLFVTYDGTTLTLSDEFGVLLTVNYSIQEQTSGTKFGYNFVGQMQDICIFNFDMSADDAPYTIEDYKNGKAIPPSILDGTQTILALENYTINRKILDYSGNKNHATVIGSVTGDNDTRIESFVEEITTSTSEQN